MEGVAAASSIISVIQIAAALGSLLKGYYESVRNARREIQSLYQSITRLQDILGEIQQLASRDVFFDEESGTLQAILVELRTLEAKLGPVQSPNSRSLRWIKSLKWPFQREEVNKIVMSIEHHKSTLQLQFDIEILGVELDAIDILEDIKKEIRAEQGDADRRRIVDWLSNSVPDPSEEHNIARDKHEPTTCEWLIKGGQLDTWMSSRNSLLWLQGGAGSGKSISCSTVIHHVQEVFKDEPRAAVAYWYFKFSDLKKQSVSSLLCSLVRDICSNRFDTPPGLQKAYDYANRGQQRPTSLKLRSMLQEVIEDFEDIFLVVDAVDECPKFDGERARFFETLQEMLSWESTQLHVFMTSRPEVDIQLEMEAISRSGNLGSFETIKAQGDECHQDIEKYLDRRLHNKSTPRWWNSDLKKRIRTELSTRANGMFRLVALQLDSLYKCRTEKSVLAALKSLPKTLDSFYERTLQEIAEEDQRHALVILYWVAYAAREVSLEELAEAIVVQPQSLPYLDIADRFPRTEMVLEILPVGLIQTWKKDNVTCVQLAHFSVLEYLVSDRIKSSTVSQYQINEITANTTISEICLAYLLQIGHENPPISRSLYLQFPLLHYAATCWSEHLRILQAHPRTSTMDELSLLFLRADSNAWKIWLPFGSLTSGNAFGIPYLEEMIRQPLQYQLKDYDDFSRKFEPIHPLSWASAYGHEDQVEMLLAKTPDINEVPMGDVLGTPLCAASRYGKVVIARLLLGAGAMIDFPGCKIGTALHAAVYWGRDEMINLLLESGADINSACGFFGTPLTTAVICWVNRTKTSCRIVDLLLSHGADICIPPQGSQKWHRLVIIAVLTMGYCATIELLLEKLANMGEESKNSEIRRHSPASQGRIDVMQLLRAQWKRISIRTLKAGVPMNEGLFSSGMDCMKWLLESCIYLDGTLCKPSTDVGGALEFAAIAHHVEAVELLLEAGLDDLSWERCSALREKMRAHIRALDGFCRSLEGIENQIANRQRQSLRDGRTILRLLDKVVTELENENSTSSSTSET